MNIIKISNCRFLRINKTNNKDIEMNGIISLVELLIDRKKRSTQKDMKTTHYHRKNLHVLWLQKVEPRNQFHNTQVFCSLMLRCNNINP